MAFRLIRCNPCSQEGLGSPVCWACFLSWTRLPLGHCRSNNRVTLRIRFYNNDEKCVVTVKGKSVLVDGIGRATEVCLLQPNTRFTMCNLQ